MFLRAIIFLAALLVGVPVPAAGQQAGAAPIIGVLAQDLQPGLLDTFRDELQKLGYVEGKSITHYVDKLLKGEAAGTLPVEQPVSFDVVINLRTAKALGLTIPESVLIRADEIIE